MSEAVSARPPSAEHFPRSRQFAVFLLSALPSLASAIPAPAAAPEPVPAVPGLLYTNQHLPKGPWSVHVVRVDRADASLRIDTIHAANGALGLTPLSAQVNSVPPALGRPVAALNGDFYHWNQAYLGDPRGPQIVDGELISAPAGGAAFWLDALGQPHADLVSPRFEVTWPDGAKTPFVLNADRSTNAAALYTPALGPSTRTVRGREFVLESTPNNPWLPLRIGLAYTARIRTVRDLGDTPIAPETMVLSVAPALARKLPPVPAGAEIQFSTASAPDLRGARTAIGGGPILLRDGRRQKITLPDDESYEFGTMLQRHPRSAIGWNNQHFFLVEVDGRQKDLSVGMTLDEFAALLRTLGCVEAMNLDGGGSATLWFAGQIRNRPCDGRERPVANGLLVLRPNPGTESAPPSRGQAAHTRILDFPNSLQTDQVVCQSQSGEDSLAPRSGAP